MFTKKNKAIYINELPQNTLDKLEKNTLDFDILDTMKDDGTDVQKIENKTEPTVDITVNETIDYKARGFETLEQAIEYVNTTQFSKLGQADKNEYTAWLKK